MATFLQLSSATIVSSALGPLFRRPMTASLHHHRPKALAANADPASVFDHSVDSEEIKFKAQMLLKMESINRALDLAVPVTATPKRIHEAMRYSLLSGGKLVRPVLCIYACEIVGGDESRAMAPACALEMVQAMSLIHDDLPCMDNENLRRGLPSCHRVFGESIAVLAGDALLSLSFRHIADLSNYPSDVAPSLVLRAAAELGRGTGAEGLIAGQLLDVEATGRSGMDAEQLEVTHVLKSAALLEASVVIGAIVGEGTEGDIERMRRYGRCIGLLYQVVDDIEDVTKTSQELGKTAAKDLRDDKNTYPKIIGLERSKEFAIELLREAKTQIQEYDPSKAAPLLQLANYIFHRRW